MKRKHKINKKSEISNGGLEMWTDNSLKDGKRIAYGNLEI